MPLYPICGVHIYSVNYANNTNMTLIYNHPHEISDINTAYI